MASPSHEVTHEVTVEIDVPDEIEAYARWRALKDDRKEHFEDYLLECLSLDIDFHIDGVPIEEDTLRCRV